MSNGLRQEAFLNNIAAKLGRPRRSGVTPPAWEKQPYEHLYQGMDQDALIEQFIASMAALNTEVVRVSRDEFSKAIDLAIEKFGVSSVMYWDDSRLHELQLPRLLAEKQLNHREWKATEDEQELCAYAANAEMGITFAEMGLAESGTVVLMNGAGRGRLVSLLPPVYVAVLRESDIRLRLSDGVAYVHSQVPGGLPACINFISGPSRTGDIEGDLALGVHGPGNVLVILLQE